jgi:dolichyl-diphosphooligosaccharide--protein glycosyltransferase
LEQDGFTPKPLFWTGTFLGKLFPFQPANYVSIGQQGSQFHNNTEPWQRGWIQLYTKHVKYPESGGNDQPLKLVYASPSFTNKNNIMFGVFIYKVNHDFLPKPKPAVDMTTSNKIAVINTTQGVIKIEFFPNAAPKHVDNFMKLASDGFYNGTLFHRIIPGFVIQGGDPNTKGDASDRSTWGQGGPNSTVPAEFNDIHHTRGIVSMARAQDPNSAGSQFFIVLGDNASTKSLDGKYSVFGRVISGMDVVDKIAALQTIGGSGPDSTQPANIEQARILSIEIVPR